MNEDEREIRQLVATWFDATKRGDIATVLSLMADDVVFLVTGQPPMIGKAAFEAALRAQPASPRGAPMLDGQSEIQEIQIHAGWAHVWTSLRVVVSFPDGRPPVTRAGHTLSVLRKEAGRWVLARDANMLALAAPASR